MDVNVGLHAVDAMKSGQSDLSDVPSLVAGVKQPADRTAGVEGSSSRPSIPKQRSTVDDPEEDHHDMKTGMGVEEEELHFQNAVLRRFSKDLMDNPQNILQLPGTQELVTKIDKQLQSL